METFLFGQRMTVLDVLETVLELDDTERGEELDRCLLGEKVMVLDSLETVLKPDENENEDWLCIRPDTCLQHNLTPEPIHQTELRDILWKVQLYHKSVKRDSLCKYKIFQNNIQFSSTPNKIVCLTEETAIWFGT